MFRETNVQTILMCAQRTHYENMPSQIYWKFYHQKKKKNQIKKFWYFSYYCSKHRLWVLVRTASPRRGGSNEYPQSMFLSRNKKNNVYPCKPQYYNIKVGFKGVKIIQACFRDDSERTISGISEKIISLNSLFFLRPHIYDFRNATQLSFRNWVPAHLLKGHTTSTFNG